LKRKYLQKQNRIDLWRASLKVKHFQTIELMSAKADREV